jgi:hypothetical protein
VSESIGTLCLRRPGCALLVPFNTESLSKGLIDWLVAVASLADSPEQKFVPNKKKTTSGLLMCPQETRASPARGTLGSPFGKDPPPDGVPRGWLVAGASWEDSTEKSLSRKEKKTSGLLICPQETRASPARGTLGSPFGKDSPPDGVPRGSLVGPALVS